MSWPVVTLDSIKADVPYACVGGPFGSNLTSKHYVDEGVPVIRGQNLGSPGCFDETGFVFVLPEKADQLRSNLAFRGDVLFTQRGTLGQVGLIPQDSKYDRYVVSQSQMKLTVDASRVDARYVYQYFRLESTIQEILNRTITAGVPHINLGILKSFEIPLPPLPAQQAVAEVAEAYDDLIATNQRRIVLLEEAARRLYREWFVHLRFPGHESVPVKDGVPQGWLSVTFAELVEINPRNKFEKGVERPFVEMSALSESSMVIGSRSKRVIGGGAKFKNGDTLFARITPCTENGKTGFVQFLESDTAVASGSTEFMVFRSAKVNPWWVYCAAREDNFREHAIRSMAGSDGRQRVNPKCFNQFATLQPSQSVLELFQAAVADSFAQVENLCRFNERLACARDLLLPKLMSGQLDVSTIPLSEEVAA